MARDRAGQAPARAALREPGRTPARASGDRTGALGSPGCLDRACIPGQAGPGRGPVSQDDGRRDLQAAFDPVTVGSEADDHKACYPGSHRIAMRFTGDRQTGWLLGVQLFGHKDAEIAKRIDMADTAIFWAMTVDAVSGLDLSYTLLLGSPVGRGPARRPGLVPSCQAAMNAGPRRRRC